MLSRSGTRILIEDEGGAVHHCHSRRRAGGAVCGDRIAWESSGREGCVLTEVYPRHNEVTRRDRHRRLRTIAANVDQLVIVSAPCPAPQWDLIDRYLVAAAAMDAQALLLLNKTDLIEAGETAPAALGVYRRAGYATLGTSVVTGAGLPALAEALRGRTSILVGQSGVGKSALVQRFLPELDIAVGRLSAQGTTGRHTTTQATLYHLPQGGDLIDSPGVRTFEPPRLTPAQVHRGFREFRPHAGHCRYHNCTHTNEPGCAIMAAARAGEIDPRRLESYRHLLRSIQGQNP